MLVLWQFKELWQPKKSKIYLVFLLQICNNILKIHHLAKRFLNYKNFNEIIEYLNWYLESRGWTFANNQKEVDDYYEKQNELFRLQKENNKFAI